MWRSILNVEPDGLTVESQWHTGEGYDDGIEGRAYLLCWAALDGARCVERVEIPEDTDINWD